jgi:uncharacterized protein YcbX
VRVSALRRYPVKSMLGEDLDQARVEPAGIVGDRGLAVLDTATGLVATAKHPRLWRGLLAFAASTADRVVIRFPDGTSHAADAPDLDALLSAALGRPVTLSGVRPAGAAVERPDPEDVIAYGVAAFVPAPTLQIGQGTPGSNFVDHSPVHLITTATLAHLGAELVRYRPNLVVETPPGTRAFVENDWLGRELRIGAVRLRVTLPTPRCAVPTLAHGALPRDPQAVRAVLAGNRIEVPGIGAALPCAGAYAEVRHPGVLRPGDPVRLG